MNLEVRVRERTSELATANAALKQMVTEVSAAGEQVREALQGIIQTISLIIETRDPYTAGHQRGVADLAQAIARRMGLTEERIEGIRLAALVHDLGKISTPAEILAKPTRLTEVEMSMIRIHPRSGYEILKRVEFPWPIAQIVLQHHERNNGSGYPQGLLRSGYPAGSENPGGGRCGGRHVLPPAIPAGLGDREGADGNPQESGHPL